MSKETYICVEEFEVPKILENGSLDENDMLIVFEGSLWEMDLESNTLCGAEFRLNHIDSNDFLELSIGRLEHNFEPY